MRSIDDELKLPPEYHIAIYEQLIINGDTDYMIEWYKKQIDKWSLKLIEKKVVKSIGMQLQLF